MIPVNQYGNYDITGGIPEGLVHIKGLRLQPTCRSLGIEFAPAFCGFEGSGRYVKPLLFGVVISAADEPALRASLEKRKPHNKKALTQKHEREAVYFAQRIREQFPAMPKGEEHLIAAHACEVGSGRVGRSTVATNSPRAAVVAYIRHTHTDYDDLLDQWGDRENARAAIRAEIDHILLEWKGKD